MKKPSRKMSLSLSSALPCPSSFQEHKSQMAIRRQNDATRDMLFRLHSTSDSYLLTATWDILVNIRIALAAPGQAREQVNPGTSFVNQNNTAVSGCFSN